MKKIRRELKSQNVFYYIAAFSIIVILIITVLGSYLYRFYYRTIYTDFLVSNEEHLRWEMNRHENDIQIINDIVYQMGLAAEVTKFKLSEKPLAALQLEKHLFQYTTVSQFFRLLLYQYHEDDYLYSSTTSVDSDYFAEQGCVMERMDAQTVKEELSSESKELRVFPEQSVSGFWVQKYIGNSRIVLYMQAIPPKFQETLVFFVPDTYYDSLMINEDLRSDFILYDNEVIVSRESRETDHAALLELIKESGEQRQVKLDGEKYLLTVQQGDSGMLYCSLQDMDIFYDKIVTGQWGIIGMLIICAIPTVLLLVVLSRKMALKVRPMNKRKRKISS